MKKESIAQICHEANRAYCQSIGDNSQLPWSEAPQWAKDSAIKGVEFHSGHIIHSPSASHEAWYNHKLKDGWKYGPVKDPDKKEHPCMVPYNDLPEEQRIKDYLFQGICVSLKKFIE
jgi:hypothetical protein